MARAVLAGLSNITGWALPLVLAAWAVLEALAVYLVAATLAAGLAHWKAQEAWAVPQILI